MNSDRCEVFCYDEVKVKRLRTDIAKVDFIETSQLFKALSDPTRLKIAYCLSFENELCVCDIAHIIDSSIATASHHVRLLRNMGLAKYRKEGKLVFYSLTDEHIKQLVQVAFEHQNC